VILVRGVTSLGWTCTEALTLHFSGFGPVMKVLTTQSRKMVRPGTCRIRPGGIAFVVMEDARSVQRILQAGQQQTVASKSISVQPYTAPPPGSPAASSGDGTSTSAGSASSARSSSEGPTMAMPAPAKVPATAGLPERPPRQFVCPAGEASSPGRQEAAAAATPPAPQLDCGLWVACRAGEGRAERGSSGTSQGAHGCSSDMGAARQDGTITRCLRSLGQEDPNRVILVRGVTSLGWTCTEALTLHFSGFGPVMKVLTTQSRKMVRPGTCRIRPGGIAFVVMEDARSVQRILQAGQQQTVASKSISVQPYTAPPPGSPAASSGDGTSTSAGSASSARRSSEGPTTCESANQARVRKAARGDESRVVGEAAREAALAGARVG